MVSSQRRGVHLLGATGEGPASHVDSCFVAELVFFTGTMDCGKSTLALQMDYNHAAQGRRGLLFAMHDRSGRAQITSRLGLTREAIEVNDELDFWDLIVDQASHGRSIDYLICDEAQFYSPEQVEQLARLVDEMNIDVYTFGITADFRTQLFPGSRRLIELADRMQVLQVKALCWCGRVATHNARVIAGTMVIDGDQVAVGDMASDEGDDEGAAADGAPPDATVEYEVLCRRHYSRRMTAQAAREQSVSPDTLPFDLDLCPLPGR